MFREFQEYHEQVLIPNTSQTKLRYILLIPQGIYRNRKCYFYM